MGQHRLTRLSGAVLPGLAIDTDPNSPIYMLRPDHRAALLNIEHSWTDTAKVLVMRFSFTDRDLGSIDITAVRPSLIRRFHEPATM